MGADIHHAVSDEAVSAALEAVAKHWRGSRSALQQYPSRSLTRVMLEAAAPHIAAAAEREPAAPSDPEVPHP